MDGDGLLSCPLSPTIVGRTIAITEFDSFDQSCREGIMTCFFWDVSVWYQQTTWNFSLYCKRCLCTTNIILYHESHLSFTTTNLDFSAIPQELRSSLDGPKWDVHNAGLTILLGPPLKHLDSVFMLPGRAISQLIRLARP